jgi:hypothetical protein
MEVEEESGQRQRLAASRLDTVLTVPSARHAEPSDGMGSAFVHPSIPNLLKHYEQTGDGAKPKTHTATSTPR